VCVCVCVCVWQSVGDLKCDPCIALGQHLFGQGACRDYQQHSAETLRHQSTRSMNAGPCVYVGKCGRYDQNLISQY